MKLFTWVMSFILATLWTIYYQFQATHGKGGSRCLLELSAHGQSLWASVSSSGKLSNDRPYLIGLCDKVPGMISSVQDYNRLSAFLITCFLFFSCWSVRTHLWLQIKGADTFKSSRIAGRHVGRWRAPQFWEQGCETDKASPLC